MVLIVERATGTVQARACQGAGPGFCFRVSARRGVLPGDFGLAGKRVGQIGDQVIDMLDTDRKADQPFCHAHCFADLCCNA